MLDCEKLANIFERLSGKVSEVYDLGLSEEITEIFEELVSCTLKIAGEREELEGLIGTL